MIRIARHAGTGATLPLSSCSPASSYAMATLVARCDRLADEDRAGRCDRLQARCRVHQVARDHALARRAERHRRLAREHAAAGLDPGPEGLHGIDEVEARADRPLGVVLVRDRGAPQGHHRVADELLDACRRSA